MDWWKDKMNRCFEGVISIVLSIYWRNISNQELKDKYYSAKRDFSILRHRAILENKNVIGLREARLKTRCLFRECERRGIKLKGG